MNARIPEPAVLNGTHVRLEPLGLDHVPGLLSALAEDTDDEVWRWMPAARPADDAAMGAWVEWSLATRLPWAITLTTDGTVVGSTSYLNVEVAHRRLEVGWTWVGQPWWRTAVNPECKLLLLGRAFDDLGMERVELRTDAENGRSQRAIERLGAAREGVLRRHRLRPDGTWRDTVYYSVLREEWPAVRDGLLARVSGSEPVSAPAGSILPGV